MSNKNIRFGLSHLASEMTLVGLGKPLASGKSLYLGTDGVLKQVSCHVWPDLD
jgi:hypothetical protein